MYLLSRQDGSGGAGGAPGGAPMLPPPVNLPADPTAAVIAITVIMFIIVVLKVGYRAFVVKHPQWDDLAAGLGALLTVAMTAVIVSVFNEAGLKHRALVSPIVVGAPQFTNRLFVYTLLSAVPNGFAKLAILSLLATVFPRIARPITAYFVYFGMAVVVLFYSILVIYTGVKCGPKNGVSCSVPLQVNLAKASTTVNLILDVYIMIISVWNIMSLQLTRRRKFGIVAVFLTGIL
ncbi:hypothetical protein SLS60_004325 [Paraconiothyrium brasiliense]|uniref:Rhodopsin domain-containing protein n=1 Tax=Paraconiothyrium brasiliense TaxID=300254 RepID=A0ABR3RK37_9PLEO